MRHIRTFILRLYTDLELPEKTCGGLHALPDRKTFLFKNDAELLDKLHRPTNKETKDPL